MKEVDPFRDIKKPSCSNLRSEEREAQVAGCWKPGPGEESQSCPRGRQKSYFVGSFPSMLIPAVETKGQLPVLLPMKVPAVSVLPLR